MANPIKFPYYGDLKAYDITVADVERFLKKAIPEVAEDVSNLNYLEVGSDDKHIYAILVGWSEGFDPNDPGVVDGYGLCFKLGYKPFNGMLYDFDDWTMPYDEVSGEVWDTNCSISSDVSSVTSDAEWIFKEWQEFCAAYADSVVFYHTDEE